MIGTGETVRREQISLGWYVMRIGHEMMRSVDKEGILRSHEVKDLTIWKQQNKEQEKNGRTDKPMILLIENCL